MDKNTTIYFSFEHKDYPNVSMTFEVDDDMDIWELVGLFRKFAFAIGYAEESINKVIKVE